ncbi:MAG: phosphatase PAP2 family protein [Proteobacteria bacterium]|nr:phosphatase PAP2 family protein [Pseudomonadota bacterium]
MMNTPVNRLFNLAIKPSVIISFTVFIILAFFYIDPFLAQYFHEANLRLNFPLLNYITHLGLGGFYLPSFLILALFFRYRKDKAWENRFWFLFMAVFIPGMICVFLKVILGRARPVLLFSDDLYGFFGLHFKAIYWSFPSGHTTTIMSAAFALSVIFPRFFYLFMTLGLMVSSSRILLTSHYLSDVLVAAYLSLIEIGFLLYFLKKKGLLKPVAIEALTKAHAPG